MNLSKYGCVRSIHISYICLDSEWTITTLIHVNSIFFFWWQLICFIVRECYIKESLFIWNGIKVEFVLKWVYKYSSFYPKKCYVWLHFTHNLTSLILGKKKKILDWLCITVACKHGMLVFFEKLFSALRANYNCVLIL